MPLPLSTLHIRRIVIGVAAFIVGITILWWGLWSLAASQYRGVIDKWIESGRAAGYDITFAKRDLFGFPRHVVLRFEGLHWKNADGIDFHAGTIDIGAIPWRWNSFEARFKGEAEIDVPLDEDNHSLVLAGQDGRAHVKLGTDGTWVVSHIEMTEAKIGRMPDELFTAKALEVAGTRPEIDPTDHKDAGLTLTGDAENVALPANFPTPFGPAMDHMQFKLRVMDAVPDFRKRASVAAWNKDMGVVEFDELRMDWGPLHFSGKGTMGFDDDLQPEGAFSSVVGNQDAVLKALLVNNFIPARQEAMLHSSLNLFAKPTSLDGVSGVEVPITVQLGGLFLGPVKIFSFPEIVWPGTPQPVPMPAEPADKESE